MKNGVPVKLILISESDNIKKATLELEQVNIKISKIRKELHENAKLRISRVYKPNQKGESIILLILPMTRKPKVLLKIPMMEPKILRIEPKFLLKISMMEPKILLKILMMEITNLAQVSSDRTDILFYTSNE